jgi:RNA polymerase sigma-70 factor, ECF subfamily
MDNLREKFSQIYDQCIGKIYRFVFLKVNSRETAEDLTSETFLRCWKVMEGGTCPENHSAFLYKIARNLVIDHYRQKPKNSIISADLVSWQEAMIDPRSDFEDKANLQSELAEIKSALAGINEDYQNAIIWYYLDDLPICEVAKLLDRTESATRVLVHRALESLRKQLDRQRGIEEA